MKEGRQAARDAYEKGKETARDAYQDSRTPLTMRRTGLPIRPKPSVTL